MEEKQIVKLAVLQRKEGEAITKGRLPPQWNLSA
jgi:hypothetical protein